MRRTDARNSEEAAREWHTLGQRHPFWAVLSEDRYRGEELAEADLQRFLETGEEHVAAVWATAARVFGEPFVPRRVLDFGCGVGRITLPLARRSETVVGVDAAASMIARARCLMETHGARNVDFVESDATLSSVTGPFDLVHSMLVFQHIPTEAGLALIDRLIAVAGDEAAIVLHVLYHTPFPSRYRNALTQRLARRLRRAAGRPPEIQMNAYPLDKVFGILQRAGIRRVHVELTDHAGHAGALLFCRKELTKSERVSAHR